MRFLSSILILLVIACQNPKEAKIITVNQPETKKITLQANTKAVSLSIEGMVCAMGCAATIEKNLAKTPGVVTATVDFEAKKGWVVFDSISPISKEKLIAIVEESGDGKTYTVKELKDIDPLKWPGKD